ncbi:exported hypothetical protein [Klebsiella variicola]|nr:exported hypothetical protein [Klebsiella variicola]
MQNTKTFILKAAISSLLVLPTISLAITSFRLFKPCQLLRLFNTSMISARSRQKISR